MSWLRPITGTSPLAGLMLALALALGLFPARAVAGQGDVCDLQLEVFINQAPTHLIGAFEMLAGRKIAARRAELEEIGLKPHGQTSADEMIVLD